MASVRYSASIRFGYVLLTNLFLLDTYSVKIMVVVVHDCGGCIIDDENGGSNEGNFN